jgi:hydroxylamine reductase
LNYIVNGLSQVAVEDRKVGVNDQEINYFTSKAIFSTLTNVDFDPERFVDIVNEAVEK